MCSEIKNGEEQQQNIACVGPIGKKKYNRSLENQEKDNRKTRKYKEATETQHNTEKRIKHSKLLTSAPREENLSLLTQNKPREGW